MNHKSLSGSRQGEQKAEPGFYQCANRVLMASNRRKIQGCQGAGQKLLGSAGLGFKELISESTGLRKPLELRLQGLQSG